MIKDILNKLLNETVTQIKNNIDVTGKKATGETQRNIVAHVTFDNSVYNANITAPNYIENLETGTPPTRGFNVLQVNQLQYSLMDWAEAKGIKVKDIVSFTFNTARLILSEGSKQWRNKQYTNVFTDEINQLARDAVYRVQNAVITEIYQRQNEIIGFKTVINL